MQTTRSEVSAPETKTAPDQLCAMFNQKRYICRMQTEQTEPGTLEMNMMQPAAAKLMSMNAGTVVVNWKALMEAAKAGGTIASY